MSERPSQQHDLSATSVLGIHHVGVAVSDLATSAAFYQTTASMERLSPIAIGSEQPLPPTSSEVLSTPNGILQLMQFPDSRSKRHDVVPVEGPGITHVCFQSPADLELYRRFEQAGATPVSRGTPPIDLNGRGVVYAYARDNDGIMFEVEQLDAPKFDGPVWLAHVALVSHDLDRLVDFYRNLLGVEPYGRANKLGGPRWDEVTGLDNVRVRAAWFNTGNMIIELWQYVTPTTAAPGSPLPFDQLGYNKIAIEVGDLGVERRRLEGAGATFLNDPIEQNGVTEAFLRDPDGNLLSLLQTSPGAAVTVADLKKIDWHPSPSAPEVA